MFDSHAVQPPKSQKVSRMMSNPSTSGYHRLPPSTPTTLPALSLQPKRFGEDLQWPEACPASPGCQVGGLVVTTSFKFLDAEGMYFRKLGRHCQDAACFRFCY